LIVVMSPRAQESRWVKREILLAEDQQKPLFPVLLEGKLWSRLADIQAIDMSGGLRAPLPESFITRLRAVLPMELSRGIEFTIVEDNILTFDTDVLALKYARGFHGVDGMVAQALMASGTDIERLKPLPGEHSLVEGNDMVAARSVLYVGSPSLRDLRSYLGIRELAANTLRAIAKEAPHIHHLATTIHGPGFGLDETEALRYQVLGFTDAILEGAVSDSLRRITIVEIDGKRVERLRKAIETDFQGVRGRLEGEWGYVIGRPQQKTAKPKHKSKPTAEDIKPHAFVVMPNTHDSDDLFYYGIQGAVHAAGLLCERLEQHELNEETLAQITERIATAAVVIAEVSEHTPSIYLQVGYAWGKERPTILLVKEAAHLPMNVSCITYQRIKDVEAGLTAQLKGIQQQ
jgi:hypothetical protein